MGLENLEVREGAVMAGEAAPNSLASIEKKERAQMARNNEKRNPLKPKTKDVMLFGPVLVLVLWGWVRQ